MNASGERLVPRPPTAEEYRALCTAVGWQEVMNLAAAAEAALRHGLHAVVVEPAHQGRGVGERIVAALVDWVRAHAPDRAFLGVFAVAGTEGFYGRHGFERHDGLAGLFQVVRREGADTTG